MYVENIQSITEQYVGNAVRRNKFTGMLNANFQDYLSSLEQSGKFTIKSRAITQKVSAVASSLGMGAGVIGGPAGVALGFAIGSSLGKYIGNVVGERIYGQAIADMNDIAFESKTRHAQLAASLAFTNQIDGAINTLRQNENKRLKDAMQGMQV